MESEVMENPINPQGLKWPAIVSLSAALMAISITILINGDIFKILVISIPGAIIMFVAIGCPWECIRRPKTVVITEGGVIMKMRYGRGIEMVKWHEIEYLSLNLTYDINTYYGRDGYLDYGNKIRTMYRPIIIAIRERYKEIMGKYPPIREGFH